MQPGTHVFEDWPLDDLRPYIDWTPFFRAWELAGNYPAILEDDVVGESARGLFADAEAMLDTIIAEKWLTARGVAALWPAKREGDDIIVSPLPMLRQQIEKRKGRAMWRLDSKDQSIMFAVTTYPEDKFMIQHMMTISRVR